MLANLKLAAIRKKKGLSMNEVASAAGISQTTISRYESGQIKKLDLEKLSKIANVLDISLEELISDDPLYAENVKSAPYAKREPEVTIEDEMDKEMLFSFHRLSPAIKQNLINLAHVIVAATSG